MTTFRRLLTATGLVLIVAACSGGGSAASITPQPDADLTITARNFSFEPASVTVPSGRPVELFSAISTASPTT